MNLLAVTESFIHLNWYSAQIYTLKNRIILNPLNYSKKKAIRWCADIVDSREGKINNVYIHACTHYFANQLFLCFHNDILKRTYTMFSFLNVWYCKVKNVLSLQWNLVKLNAREQIWQNSNVISCALTCVHICSFIRLRSWHSWT